MFTNWQGFVTGLRPLSLSIYILLDPPRRPEWSPSKHGTQARDLDCRVLSNTDKAEYFMVLVLFSLSGALLSRSLCIVSTDHSLQFHCPSPATILSSISTLAHLQSIPYTATRVMFYMSWGSLYVSSRTGKTTSYNKGMNASKVGVVV